MGFLFGLVFELFLFIVGLALMAAILGVIYYSVAYVIAIINGWKEPFDGFDERIPLNIICSKKIFRKYQEGEENEK